ncbi:hypothetical protein FA95DRAFT_1578402 [Auriscalpium vulgare]|uniref:Uncharacterized protein n=1 Tax=Auriscalpium vulgare TaxID=40419 RepID=A0ACB8R2T9_9AGAM|nr:hypothetical protein FA95DRAFT_1578402 [Auriscalpium vulgare]
MPRKDRPSASNKEEEAPAPRPRTRQQTAGSAGARVTTKAKSNAPSRKPAAPVNDDVAQEPASGRIKKKKAASSSATGRKRALTSGETPADAKKSKTGAQEAHRAGIVSVHDGEQAATEGDEEVAGTLGGLQDADHYEEGNGAEAAMEDDDDVVDGLKGLHVDEAAEHGATDEDSSEREATDASDDAMQPGSVMSLSDEEEEGYAAEEEEKGVARAPGGRKKGKAAARHIEEAIPKFVATSDSEGGDDPDTVDERNEGPPPSPPQRATTKSKRTRVQSDDTDSGVSRAELQPTLAKKKARPGDTRGDERSGSATQSDAVRKASSRPKPTPITKSSEAAKAQGNAAAGSALGSTHASKIVAETPKATPKTKPAASTPAAPKMKLAASTPAAPKTKPAASTPAAPKTTPAASTPAAPKKKPAASTPAAPKTTPAASTPAALKTTPAASTPAALKTTPAASTPAAPKTTPAASTPARSVTPAVASAAKPRRVAMHAGPGPKKRKQGPTVADHDEHVDSNEDALVQDAGDYNVEADEGNDQAAEGDEEYEDEEDEKETAGGGGLHAGASAGRRGQGGADEWPAYTNLAYTDNKVSRQHSQTPQIQQVITEANTKQIPRGLCWRHAMPTSPLIHDIVREALINAARACEQDDIERRLRADKSYAREMGSIATQGRCSTFRSETYKKAQEVDFSGLYKLDKLKSPEKIADAIAAVFKKPIVTFTYSGDPLLSKYEQSEPFCHVAIVAVLRVLFGSKKRYQPFPEELFESSYEEGEEAGELELPIAMVAYAATIVGAWLKQNQSGTFIKVSFSTTTFSGMYNDLLNELKRMKRETPEGFHDILNHLYMQVMGISIEENTDPSAVSQVEGTPVADFKNVGIKKKGRGGN